MFQLLAEVLFTSQLRSNSPWWYNIQQCKQQDFWRVRLLFIISSWRWFAHSIDSQHPESSKPMSLLKLLVVCVICKRELKIKEALHIQMTPYNNKFNRDIGLELPGCWLSMLCANHLIVSITSRNLAVYIVLFIISPRRVQPQLTREEDFGKKLKCRVKF